jgi:transcriptional regulator with XRE-family HTH domain
MDQRKPRTTNHLLLYRKRRQLSQKAVAVLLGRRNSTMLSRYENGKSLPPLSTALRLEIIYRVPVAFLFPRMYDDLRIRIRDKEGRLAGVDQ